MKFLRYGPEGQEKPACLDAEGNIRDLSAHVSDFAGDTVSCDSLNALAALDVSALPVLPAGGRIACPLADVPNFYCIGLNYAKHAAETGSDLPPEPLIFNKATSALAGPFDTVPRNHGSDKTDWEVEIGFVVGRPCFHVSQDEALDYVSAYFTANDISEREFQKNRGGQWIKGKSGPNAGPIGPYLVTPDDVGDPQTLNVSTKVNGVVMQSSNTADMIFSIRQIISAMSQYFALRTGDIVITGTPEGVGAGMSPPTFLKNGDIVECEVEGLGAQRLVID